MRLQQRGDVVEYDDIPGRVLFIAGQCGAGTGQYSTTDVTTQNDLLTPLGLARTEMHLGNVDELFEQGAAFGQVCKVLAGPVLEVHAQDRAGRLVRIADPQVGFERQDACRQPRQDDLEVGTLGLDQGL